MKRTKEEFIKKAKTVHGDRFDYIDINFINMSTKIKIRCIKHNNIFYQTPSTHLTGRIGCTECVGIVATVIKFIADAVNIHGNKYDYSTVVYINRNTKVSIRCVIHDHTFKQIPKTHLFGNTGCIYCKQSIAKQEFISDATNLFNTKYDYTNIDWVNKKTKIEIKCIEHDISFKQTPEQHLNTAAGCSICQKNKFEQTNLKKYGVKNPFQSSEIQEKSKQTSLERYGVEYATQSPEIQEKIKQTNLKKYGVEYVLQSSKIQEKSKQRKKQRYGDEYYNNYPKQIETMLNRYGVEHALQSPESLNKLKETMLNRYGVEHALQSPESLNKLKETMLNRYGVEHALHSPKFLNKFKETMLNRYGVEHNEYINMHAFTQLLLDDKEWLQEQYADCLSSYTLAKMLNVTPRTILSRLYKFNIPIVYDSHMSSFEYEIQTFIHTIYTDEIITNTREIISPLELDIYLPNINIAIELNGMYWHSELQGKDKNYHLNKTNRCEAMGIRLIHIWDYEWNKTPDIIKSLLSLILQHTANKYDARKCTIKKITQLESYRFLEDNHLQGGIYAPIRLGLFHNNILISLAIFAKSRYARDIDYELIRFVNKTNCVVRGGFGKLIKYFTTNYQGSLMSYVDKSKFIGNSYNALGFKYSHSSKPNFKYFKNNKLYSREAFQKHKLIKKLENFNEDISAWANMQQHGYNRIWDCGNDIYILKQKDSK